MALSKRSLYLGRENVCLLGFHALTRTVVALPFHYTAGKIIFLQLGQRLAAASPIQASDDRQLIIGREAIVQRHFVKVSLVSHF
jgi:hypothetical protein